MKRSSLQKKFQAEDYELRLDTLRTLVQHENGRQLLWWLLEQGRAIGYNPFTNNALTTAFNCGIQQVGALILNELITASPEALPELMQWSADRERDRQARLAAASPDGIQSERNDYDE